MRDGTLGVVLKGYPRLSETFIAQELAGLEERGFAQHLVSLRHPTDPYTHPVHDRIRAPVSYLPEYLYQEPARVRRAWADVRTWPTYRRVRAAWLNDVVRDRTPNRGRRFGQALVLASELRGKVNALYAHFLHTPASVACYAAGLLDIPWVVSAHAKDVWTTPEWEKREKLASCRWLVTCTEVNARHLTALSPVPEKVSLVYHGLDFSAFPPPDGVRLPAGEEIKILSVGRAVEKKGYDDLLAALARLPPDLPWRFRHIGGGQLSAALKRQATELGLDCRIEWSGALPQPKVLDALRQCDVFVLASRVAKGGDRDGLPNVLMEAFSQAVACVATNVSAIPELIEDGENGLLVEPRDVPALAERLELLLRDPQLRKRLGQAALHRVRREFAHDAGLDVLAAKLAAI